MDMDEINEVLADLEKEKSDREFEETFNRERLEVAHKIMEKKHKSGETDYVPNAPLRVHFRRPPKTSEEVVQTLQEADQRFEMNKSFLVGKEGSLVQEESNTVKQEKLQQNILESIPDGVTISRLVYPVTVNKKTILSDIILLGVQQRAVVHASYVNGKSEIALMI